MRDEPDALLNVQQVAARYGVKPQTIWAWMRKRRFPQPRRITPGCSRWPLAELEAFDRKLDAERVPRHQWERRYGSRRRSPPRRTRW